MSDKLKSHRCAGTRKMSQAVETTGQDDPQARRQPTGRLLARCSVPCAQLISDSPAECCGRWTRCRCRPAGRSGRHREFEQGGAQRAAYGQRLLVQLGQALAAEFGPGFDATNLRHMRRFYLGFPIRDALRRELSWTHYRLLLRVDAAEARQWYLQEAATQNWSTRVLERQIGSLYHERLLASQDQAALLLQTRQEHRGQPASARSFVRDPVMLEFLGLPEAGRLLEATLEAALMDKLQQFLVGGALLRLERQRTTLRQQVPAGAAQRGGAAARTST
jgi:hypothetical protein